MHALSERVKIHSVKNLKTARYTEKHLLLSGLTLCIVLHSWTMLRESIATLQREIAELLTIPILGHISTFVDHVIVEFVPKICWVVHMFDTHLHNGRIPCVLGKSGHLRVSQLRVINKCAPLRLHSRRWRLYKRDPQTVENLIRTSMFMNYAMLNNFRLDQLYICTWKEDMQD